MAVEEIGRLRSIAIVGQGATGKTELAEAMLFTAGTLTRQGRPDDGTAAMDFEPKRSIGKSQSAPRFITTTGRRTR